MKGSVNSARSHSISAGSPQGYTLVEILVATALTLIMIAVVVQIFGSIGESVSKSRATLEMSDRVRTARTKLEMDLAGITATMLPPLRPETNEGYFEYIEGPVGPVRKLTDTPPYAKDDDADDDDNDPDTKPADFTVGDIDDCLMFTTRSAGRPFVGRYWDPLTKTQSTIESDVAEVAWFLRGRTLYRRVMLVVPGLLAQLDADHNGVLTLAEVVPADAPPKKQAFFYWNDVSVRWSDGGWIPNTLGDLTKRECRYAHDFRGFPFDARGWEQLGLPTLRECSSPSWVPGRMRPIRKFQQQIDLWNNPHPWSGVDRATGTLNKYHGLRIAEDVILTNVISFDVKAWDPGGPVIGNTSVALGPSDPGYQDLVKAKAPVINYGAYVDLGYAPGYAPASNAPTPRFHHAGEPRSRLNATDSQPARVYDTWSFHYEHDGENQDRDRYPNNTPRIDEGTDGFDNDGLPGIVDDPAEMETSPPYPVPLRAIQVKIRVFEPDSRQVREVTVVQDFLPK